ncbi:MAG TPA: PorV/PorQ family protein [Bacteroidota bacterium]|nr:PorV/PorQ family protein [Bacteroidota bacterium]
MRARVFTSMRMLLAMFLIVAAIPVAGMAQMGAVDVSKTGTTAATFLEISVGAPAIGVGGAFVSLANDATALYWNPAGIATLPGTQAVLSHTDWIADTKFDFAGLAVPLESFGTLGFSLTSLTMGDMPVTTVEMPDGTGEYFSASDVAAGISYARPLTDRFSIGFTAKFIQESIWHETADAFAVDAGTVFKTDLFGGMVIGASLTNFGTPMTLTGSDTRQFLRIDATKQGSNDQIPADIEMNSWDLPLRFQIGVSTNLLNSDMYRWTVAVDAIHPNDNYESMNVGSEFALRDFLFLRAGYQSLFLSQSEGGLSLGVGVTSGILANSSAVKFDYAYRDYGRLEGVHSFSLAVRF